MTEFKSSTRHIKNYSLFFIVILINLTVITVNVNETDNLNPLNNIIGVSNA